MRHMRVQLVALALTGLVTMSACGSSDVSASAGWKQSSTPDCSGGLCAEFNRADTAASIIIVTGSAPLPSGDGYEACGTLRGAAAMCRKLADTEQVTWQGAGDVLYEASAKGTTREQLMRFVKDLDLESAGLQP